MSEQDLDLLITIDDPGEDDLEEDTFHDLQAENTSQPLTAKGRLDKRREVILGNDSSKVTG